jgi:hypothetical protein
MNYPPRADIKRESREMAARLLAEGRIRPETALWALKQSGHTKEEIQEWKRSVFGESGGEAGQEKP